MPTWNDNTVHNSNLGDRERTLRDELTAVGGSQTLSQVLSNGANAGGAVIQGAGDPLLAADVATKNYVDQHSGGTGVGSATPISFSQAGTLSVATGALRWLCPWPTATINGTVATAGTAPTGASLICDVKKNGTTIYSTSANRPTIAAAGHATTTQPAPDVTTLVAGDYLTVDIDQVGSSVAGSDLVVVISLTRTS